MATDYGTGIASISVAGGGLDLDKYFRRITGPRVVLHAVARRFVTPRGSLWWAPDDGYDIRQLLLDGFKQTQIPTYEREIQTEAEKDERVLSADVVLSYADERLRVDVNLILAEGTFRLVMDVTTVTAAIILAA